MDDQNNIFDAYKQMQLINEKKKTGKGGEPIPHADEKPSKMNKLSTSHTGPDDKAPKVKNGEKGKFSENVEKIVSKPLNNFMTKKSLFDKLFEQAMTDEEALGIPPGEGGEGSLEGDVAPDESLGDLEDDSVTFTVDKACAQALYDALGAVLTVEDEPVDEFADEAPVGDEDAGADEFDDSEGAFGESTDIKELGKDGSELQKLSNRKVNAHLQPKGTKADGSVKGPHDLKPAKTAVDTGKNNKVGKIKPGDHFFNA